MPDSGANEERSLKSSDRRTFLQNTIGIGVGSVISLGSIRAASAAGGERIWQFDTGNVQTIQSSPTVVDGTVYIDGGHAGREHSFSLYAIDAEDGTMQWEFDPGVEWWSSPTVVDGIVFVAGRDAWTGDEDDWETKIYALDATDGTEYRNWTFGPFTIFPIVVDGIIFAPPLVLNPADGSVNSSQAYTVSGSGSKSVMIDGHHFYNDDTNNAVYAVDVDDENELWSFSTEHRIASAPTVWDGSAFVGTGRPVEDTERGYVYSIDVEDGTERWSFETDTWTRSSSPTVSDGRVFVGTYDDGKFYALNADDGTEIWSKHLMDTDSSATVVDGIVLVKSGDTVYALDAEDGTEYWGKTVGSGWSEVVSSPTVVDGTLYVGGSNHVHAIDVGVDGSSEDSRVMLGATGHHGDWIHSGQTIDIERETANGEVGDDTTSETSEDDTTIDEDGDDTASETSEDDTIDSGNGNDITAGENGDGFLSTETALAVGGGGLATLLSAYGLMRATSDDSEDSTTRRPENTPTNAPDTPSPSQSSESKSGTVEPSAVIDQVESHLGRVTEKATTAREARQSGEYDRALTACETARDTAETAHKLASENAPERVSKIESKRSRVDQLEREIQAERDTYQTVTESLNSLSERVDDAASRLDSDPEETLASLEDIEDDLSDVSEKLKDYDFTGATQECERLERQCEQLRKQAEDAQSATPVPKTIPSSPRQSLVYEDLRKGDPIGSGGNADVYHATATTDEGGIELAVKEPRMSGTLHTETIERMLTEAETWQQLDDHNHIVSVVDYGAEPLPWIAMEYMDGGHIGERAEEMSAEQKLWTAITTTKAVRHAHRRGVAHLDLKPENILFCSVEDAWDVPKVADWGLSKHLLKHSKSVEGMSPHYAAPEQFDEEFGVADDITDIYQLGAVFYELFTGRPPFEGRPTKVMRAVMDEEPTPPSQIADVPTELDEILLTALAKEKDDRYETVIYLRDELQRLR